MENMNNYENIAFFGQKKHTESSGIVACQNLQINTSSSDT